MGGGKERKGGSEDLASRARIVAIEYKSESETSPLKPVLIGAGHNPELENLINGKVVEIGRKLDGLRKSGDIEDLKKARYPRPGAKKRGSRELKDINVNEWRTYWETKKNSLIPIYEGNMQILQGEKPGRITLYQDSDGKVTQIEISRMSEKEIRLWQPIIDASNKADRVAPGSSDKALELIVRAYEQLSRSGNGFEPAKSGLSAEFKTEYYTFLGQNPNPDLEVLMGDALRAMRERL